ncbi:calmodulin-binding protein 25 [Setaria italica]|nr:calmodulin-binding protein 25 [Setaria italica]
MANPCAALDPTWAHLPAPAPTHVAASHYCLFPAAAFENEALTSALRASMAPAHAAAAAKSLVSPAVPSSSTSSASEILSSGHDAPAPASRPPAAGRPPARALKGPKVGRVSKRKPRPSRRAQTTYITADPADFRRMVQEITGLPVPGPASSSPAASGAAAAPSWTPAPAPLLPTLDTSAFLLDASRRSRGGAGVQVLDRVRAGRRRGP